MAKTNFLNLGWKIIEENAPFYRKLSNEDKKELQRHILIFMGEKHFEGCGGLKITDQIKVTIATQACILLLHRQTDYYPGLSSIIVYPHSYVACMIKHLPGGVVTEGLDMTVPRIVGEFLEFLPTIGY